MFHIFDKMRIEMLPRFVSLGKVYVVAQQYHQYHDHFSDEQKTSLLLSTYDDPGLARLHLSALTKDKYAAIINLKNAKHLKKLEEMLEPESKYHVFWAAVADPAEVKKRMERKYKDAVRRYILKETNWKVGGAEKITPDVQLIFGELFVIIKRGREILKIKFDELEKV